MKNVFFALLATVLAACAAGHGDGLEILDLRVRPPLPGANAAVAYMRIVNHSAVDTEISAISSSRFGAAEIHLSSIDNGIASMRKLERLAVPAGGSIEFRPGSYHVMLFRPDPDLVPGQEVSIRLEYDDNKQATAFAILGEGF